MMTRSRKGDSTRSTTEEETTETSATTSEETTESSAVTEDTTMVEDVDVTLVAKGKKTKTPSNKASKKKELEARLELEKLQLEEIRMKTKLAQTKLQLTRVGEDDTDLSDDEDATTKAAAEKATEAWVSKSKEAECDEAEVIKEVPRAVETNPTSQLAAAIMEAVKSATDNKASTIMQRAPKYVSDLHQFDGDARDWMAFKATYRDSQALFSGVENMGRLRRAIKGKAKEAVKSILYTQVDPEEVITALERRFGRPTYLIRSEIENIEKLPPMSEDAREIVRYAGAVANTVSVVKQMKRESYLHSSDIANRIIEKMCILVRFKWYEYRASKEEEDEPILIDLMKFFNQMADRFEMHEFMGTKVKKEGFRGRMRPAGSRGVNTTQATHEEEEYPTSEEDSDEEKDDLQAATVCSCQEGSRKTEKIICPECNGEHPLLKCKRFVDAPVSERWEQARRSLICFRCLMGRHRGFNCKAKPCEKCKKGHHVMLHQERTLPVREETLAVASTVNAARTIPRTCLKIAPVELWGPDAKTEVYAPMDERSRVTLIEEDSASRCPEVVRAINRNHYMNDDRAKFPDAATAARISWGANEIHKEGGFVLRSWASNDPSTTEEFTEAETETSSIVLGETKDQVEKTPGLNWNVQGDSPHLTLSLRNTPDEAKEGKRAPTKREATSAVMSVFDPLGLASPITIQGKVMLQNLWRSGLEWDERLPPPRENEWQRWLGDLKKEDLRIPRRRTHDVTEGELHTFCDASEKAYACAVYWRSQHPDEHVEVKPPTAKARVSPLKPTSIPRLELQACLLGSRLTDSTSQEIDLTVTRRYHGTNFIGASRKIAAAMTTLPEEVNKMGIVWKSIPPGAPHMGGAWEVMFRSLKVALAATSHEQQPREETLHTLLLEAEHIVNSRSLFSIKHRARRRRSPDHFLIGRSCGTTLFGSFDDTELIGSSNWKTP